MNLPSWLQSSHDPAKVSLTIKGLSVFVPTAVLAASYFGLHLDSQTLTGTIDQIAVAASAVVTAWGLLRKLWAPVDPPAPPASTATPTSNSK